MSDSASPADRQRVHHTIVVGAGRAGLGIASTFGRIGIRATVVDRYGIGASFHRWPEGMHLITPSFAGSQFGLVDLDAITPDASPALSQADVALLLTAAVSWSGWLVSLAVRA